LQASSANATKMGFSGALIHFRPPQPNKLTRQTFRIRGVQFWCL
jgi:hypothetical protein